MASAPASAVALARASTIGSANALAQCFGHSPSTIAEAMVPQANRPRQQVKPWRNIDGEACWCVWLHLPIASAVASAIASHGALANASAIAEAMVAKPVGGNPVGASACLFAFDSHSNRIRWNMQTGPASR